VPTRRTTTTRPRNGPSALDTPTLASTPMPL
jgi:hypothetical protein